MVGMRKLIAAIALTMFACEPEPELGHDAAPAVIESCIYNPSTVDVCDDAGTCRRYYVCEFCPVDRYDGTGDGMCRVGTGLTKQNCKLECNGVFVDD